LNLAVNPGAPGLALPIKQVLANPASGFHAFNLALPPYGQGSRGMLFGPDELPGTVLESEFAPSRASVVMCIEAPTEILGLADVRTVSLIFEDVDPVNPGGALQAPRQGLER
jgi:hypothetical protein